MKAIPKMTPSVYAEHEGIFCPYCLYENVEGGPVEIDAGIAWQECACNNCGNTWTDQYTLTGYSDD